MATHSAEETSNRLREVINAISTPELGFTAAGDLAVSEAGNADSAAEVEVSPPSGLRYKLQLVPIAD